MFNWLKESLDPNYKEWKLKRLSAEHAVDEAYHHFAGQGYVPIKIRRAVKRQLFELATLNVKYGSESWRKEQWDWIASVAKYTRSKPYVGPVSKTPKV